MKHSFIKDSPFIAISKSRLLKDGLVTRLWFVLAYDGPVTVKDCNGHSQGSFMLFYIFEIKKNEVQTRKAYFE